MDDKKLEIGYRPWMFLAVSPILALYWLGMGMMILHGFLVAYLEENYY